MAMTTWEQKFIEFLQKHDALGQYIHNLNSLKFVGNSENIQNFPRAFLTSSFSFNATQEGVDYWMDLHRKWVLECGNTVYVPDDELEYVDG